MNPPVRTTLLPGLRLTALQTRKFRSTCWSLQFLTPLRPETAPLNLFLPDVLAQGTAQYPDPLSLGAALDRLGGLVLPQTRSLGGIQGTGFLARFPEERFLPHRPPALSTQAQLLGDLLTRPATKNGRLRGDFIKEGLSRRRQALSNPRELPWQYARRRLMQELCREGPDPFAPVTALLAGKAVSVSRLDRHYRALCSGSQIELYYCGPAPADQVRQAWAEALMDLPRRELAELPGPVSPPPAQPVRQVTERLPGAGPMLLLGLRTQALPNSTTLPGLLVLDALLRRSFVTSRMEQCRSLLLADQGLLILQAQGGEAVQTEESFFSALLDRLSAGDFRLPDLEWARRQVLSRLSAIEDSQTALETFYFRQLAAPSLLTPAQLSLLVREVTVQEICCAAASLTLDTVYRLTGEEEAK